MSNHGLVSINVINSIQFNMHSIYIYIRVYIYIIVYINIHVFPVPGSVAPPSSPMVWYPLFPQKNIPFACYLEHIYSIFTAIESRILPAKFLSTNYVLPACCLHIKYIHLCISFPLICDQYRIYILLIMQSYLTFIYYPLHACMQPIMAHLYTTIYSTT